MQSSDGSIRRVRESQDQGRCPRTDDRRLKMAKPWAWLKERCQERRSDAVRETSGKRTRPSFWFTRHTRMRAGLGGRRTHAHPTHVHDTDPGNCH